jgi:hypothetical protein
MVSTEKPTRPRQLFREDLERLPTGAKLVMCNSLGCRRQVNLHHCNPRYAEYLFSLTIDDHYGTVTFTTVNYGLEADLNGCWHVNNWLELGEVAAKIKWQRLGF